MPVRMTDSFWRESTPPQTVGLRTISLDGPGTAGLNEDDEVLGAFADGVRQVVSWIRTRTETAST